MEPIKIFTVTSFDILMISAGLLISLVGWYFLNKEEDNGKK